MTGGTVFFVRRVGTLLREARVALAELELLHEHLAHPDDVLAHSFASSEALAIIETAIAKAGGVTKWPIPDSAASAIHRTLEQMLDKDSELSSGLQELRDLVAPAA
jgi:hypothetical protein